MTRTTNQPHNSFFSSTLKTAALLGVVLSSAQFTSQASAQDSPCPEPQFDPSSLNPAPDMWIAHVRINTEDSVGPVIRDGSGFIVSPHALLLPASMLYQRGGLPNPSSLPIDEWIGSKSEYTITPNAQTVANTETSYTILAPYGTRTPSRRLISRDFITTSNSWAARVRYNWGALQFDCPFEGLGTGMAVTFSKDALNRGTATIGGYKKLEPWIWTKYSFEQAKHILDASDLKYSYSNLNMKVKDRVDLFDMLNGAGAWKIFAGIDFGTGEVDFEYGLLGLFTFASHSPEGYDDCVAVGPRFSDVGNRADSIREIMRWTPEEDCDMRNPVPWHLLMEHVRNQQPEMLIPLEQLNLYPGIDGQFDEPVSHTMQVIEHTFYEWFVYEVDPLDPMSPRAIRMVAPENRWLSAEEAQVLISASLNWANFNPPVPNPIESEFDPSIPIDNTMAMGDAPIDEDDGENDDHIEEMLVDDEQDDGSQFDPADLNQDGSVNGADLASLLGQWGNQGGFGDLNDNGFVEGGDLAVLLGRWR